LLQTAREIVTRAAAIDTGALEHLYEVDRGFTFTIATQAAAWEATLNAKGPDVRALIESQMEAYEMVLDFATLKQPIAEAWIRELHSEICKSQSTYSALTEIGWQELVLPKGQYKVSPNHVQGRDGKIHAYAPVDQVPSEMQKFIQELESDSFRQAHAVLQASYAHYAFVLIHPFADGNGRVARALASVYTYRAESIPVLILSENRNSYINALMVADERDFQQFVSFIFERVLDAIRLTSISLAAASAPLLTDAMEEYDRLYFTKGGYTHEEVDRAGYSLMDLVQSELRKQSESINPKKIKVEISVEQRSDYRVTKSSRRHPILESGRRLTLKLTGIDPRQPNFGMHLNLEVPKDCDLEDELLLSSEQIDLSFPARITELNPAPSAALHLRISIFVQGVLGLAMQRLTKNARKKLSAQGFLTP
jgi:Fic family protein